MPEARHRKLKFIGCEIIYREACYLAATGPHRVDLQFLRKGLHGLETLEMVAQVQAAVDAVGPKDGYDAILLGYARCNDGLVGVTARDVPLVIPRAHDCITFFFGSRGAYRRYFDACPGTYYMTSGWAERDRGEDGRLRFEQQSMLNDLPLAGRYDDLVAKYGRENADYIAETLGSWTRNYSKLLYLEMGVCDERAFVEATRREAERRGWDFERREGGWTLLEKLFAGRWDEDFVIVAPGERIVARNDDRVLDRSE